MKPLAAFLSGLALGAALGVGGFQLLSNEPPAAPPAEKAEEQSHAACREREETLLAELESLRPLAAEVAPERAVPEPPPTEEDAFRAAVKQVRAELRSIEDAEPGSEAIVTLMKKWRSGLESEDEKMARMAAWALRHLVAAGMLLPSDIDSFASEFQALPPGAPARPASPAS